MATVRFYSGTDMTKFDWLGWPKGGGNEPDDYRSNSILLQEDRTGDDGLPHTFEGVYGGSFAYKTFLDASGNENFLGVTSGTLTSFTLFEDEIIDATFENFSIDAVVAFNYMKLGDKWPVYNTELLSQILNGADTITGSAFNDVLRGFDGDDVISAGYRNDKISGDAGNDTLTGGGGNDQISGGAGDDFLYGGAGVDIMNGGTGADRFDYMAITEAGDKINGFSSADDTLAFLGDAFGHLAAGTIKANQFQHGVTDFALTPEVRFIYETDTGILRFDKNGSAAGGVTVIAIFDGAPDVARSDILIL